MLYGDIYLHIHVMYCFVIRHLTNMAAMRNFEIISGKIMYGTQIPYCVRDAFVTKQQNDGDNSTNMLGFKICHFVKSNFSSDTDMC